MLHNQYTRQDGQPNVQPSNQNTGSGVGAGAGGGGGGAGGGGGTPWGGPFPSLHLWPLQDTFAMKMIHLPDGQRIKIGRQTNNKTVPGERNAYFDSKVLSRLHAEIWEQGGKIYIKDVRSSNGTFINGERLSPESVESEPFELKSEDQVEFGIDIVSEDNRTIVHHKVAAKVYCVFGPEDAALSARELVNYQNQDNRGMRRTAGPPNGHPNNQLAQMGPAVMSGGGKSSGLSFDHVLTKLQAELRASKETGAELQNLASTFTDIQDTLGGGLPPSQNGSAEKFIPPQFRSASAEAQAALAGPHGQQAAAFIALQAQLNETQSSLAGHLDKIRLLEGQLQEHENIKHEVSTMREQMEESKREMDLLLAGHRGRTLGRRLADDDDDDDDDDSRSVMTLMDNEDSEQRVRDRRRAERERHPDRPRTPEPTQLNGDRDDDEEETGSGGDRHLLNGNGPTLTQKEVAEQNAELVARIQTLSSEISEAVQVSKTLQEQHEEAMSAVKLLTEKVGALETGMASKVAEEVTKVEQRWESWRVKFEEGWKRERETWEVERERLRGVVREWEEASRRAHEEEEERELNERLSGDDLEGAEGDSEENGEEDDDVEGHDEDEEGAEEGKSVLSLDGWEEGGPTHPTAASLNLSPTSSKRQRRRRPSHKAVLAVRALKGVVGDDPSTSTATGSSTPKGISSELLASSPPVPDVALSTSATGARARNRFAGNGKGRSKLAGTSGRKGKSSTTAPNGRGADDVERESSESGSGKESGDTLKEGEGELVSSSASSSSRREGGKRKKDQKTGGLVGTNGVVQPLPVFTVLVVAVVAGALYYRHKE
ncbi:hypothetical protein CI109_106172 [Kwoniella shandongensis]|uniref:Uncharacterized protein n=1 Tax=Kwoniella shandongensis TaxID=1734106 RepID=A0A5M6C3K4_9TREE|nr:uncharacterized protein CI109_003780 [Kwoniella shandongensis]KAA5527809.1 hypothetical protein CI109_003780 [Kwoniella shandongensis]